MTLPTHEFIRRFADPCCPEHCIASVTTGCSPTAKTAPPISLVLANCSPCRKIQRSLISLDIPQRRIHPIQPRALPKPCPCCGGHADHHRDLRAWLPALKARSGRRSGSTPHDAVTVDQRLCSRRSPLSQALDRPTPALAPEKPPILPADRRKRRRAAARRPLNPRTHQQSDRSNHALQSRMNNAQAVTAAKVPIDARSARRCITHRDFVPWRASGRRPHQRAHTLVTPATENLHNRRHCQQHRDPVLAIHPPSTLAMPAARQTRTRSR